jgi:predicted nucleic acid-binding protein
VAFPVVLDANVLYGIYLTDLHLTMGTERLFRPHWSSLILDEARRNLGEKRPDLDPRALDRRFESMNRALPGALVDPPEELTKAMTNDPKDRHVLALAVHVSAPTIVTWNLGDFPESACGPHDVEAISPDEFIEAQIDLDARRVMASVEAMARRKTRPPQTRDEIIDRLATEVPVAMGQLRWAADALGL